jgi:hypothetical protein
VPAGLAKVAGTGRRFAGFEPDQKRRLMLCLGRVEIP